MMFRAFGAVMRRLKAVLREVGERREEAEVGVVGIAGVPVEEDEEGKVRDGRARESFGRAGRRFGGIWRRPRVGGCIDGAIAKDVLGVVVDVVAVGCRESIMEI